jgi:hypothetical protein
MIICKFIQMNEIVVNCSVITIRTCFMKVFFSVVLKHVFYVFVVESNILKLLRNPSFPDTNLCKLLSLFLCEDLSVQLFPSLLDILLISETMIIVYYISIHNRNFCNVLSGFRSSNSVIICVSDIYTKQS